MALLTHTPAFGSFALTRANGIIIESVDEQHLNRAEFRTKLSGDGALHSRTRLSGIRVRMKGKVFGTDNGVRRTNENAFLQNIARGRQGLQVWDDRWLLCRLDGEVKLGAMPGTVFATRSWSASFRSEWDSWQAITATTDGPWNLSALPTTRAMPAHLGTAKTYPVITIENKGAGFQDKSLLLTEIAGSQQLSLQGIEMGAGQILTIDTFDGRLGDGSASAPRIASVEGDFFTIAADTTTSIEFAGNIVSPDLDITVSFYDRYWAGA